MWTGNIFHSNLCELFNTAGFPAQQEIDGGGDDGSFPLSKSTDILGQGWVA